MDFNPRTRVGCDDYERAQQVVELKISIHAPAWDATVTNVKGPLSGLSASLIAMGYLNGTLGEINISVNSRSSWITPAVANLLEISCSHTLRNKQLYLPWNCYYFIILNLIRPVTKINTFVRLSAKTHFVVT